MKKMRAYHLFMILLVITVNVQLLGCSSATIIAINYNKTVVLHHNSTNVEFRWTYTRGVREAIGNRKIIRQERDKTKKAILVGFFSGKYMFNSLLYSFKHNNTQDSLHGYFSFTIKNITMQEDNEDGSKFSYLSKQYDYVMHLEYISHGEMYAPTSTIQLWILYPPKIKDITPDIIHTPDQGKITLHCNSSGYPKPYLQWTIKESNTQIMHTSSFLPLSSILLNETSTYCCSVRNPFGKDTRCTRVVIPEKPFLKKYTNTTKMMKNSNITLFCEATGIPFPATVWSNGTNNVSKNWTYREGNTSFLIVPYQKCVNKTLQYYCQASNLAGKTQRANITIKATTTCVEKKGTTEIDLKDYSSISTAEENKTLIAVIGVLFSLSVVLNIIFIAGFLWQHRKDSKENIRKRSNNSNDGEQMNDLQETGFNATDNVTPNVPEYEPIGRQRVGTNNAGIPEYEAMITMTQSTQLQSGVLTTNTTSQYENTDQHRQARLDSDPPPATYQTIQPRTGDYGSLSPSTRLPPKGTVLASTGSPTRTREYQALQHKGVSPQYQSLDDFSKC